MSQRNDSRSPTYPAVRKNYEDIIGQSIAVALVELVSFEIVEDAHKGMGRVCTIHSSDKQFDWGHSTAETACENSRILWNQIATR